MGRGVLIALVVSLIAAPAASAADKARPLVIDRPAASSMKIRASNGYTVVISAVRHQVTISVSGRDGNADYTTRRRGSGLGIHADFGSLGRISVHFRPSGRKTIQPPLRPCRGKPRVHRFGTFVGAISFNGENGYTRVKRTRARGVVRGPMRWTCRFTGLPDGPTARTRATASSVQAVVLEAKDGTQGLTFEARNFELEGLIQLPSSLLVSLRERLGPVKIHRFVDATETDAFTYEENLTSADVITPPPSEGSFRGGAAYRISPDGAATWSGDLSADLPGTDRLSLTGPSFTVRLRRCPSALDCRP